MKTATILYRVSGDVLRCRNIVEEMLDSLRDEAHRDDDNDELQEDRDASSEQLTPLRRLTQKATPRLPHQ